MKNLLQWSFEEAKMAYEQGWMLVDCGNPFHLHAIPEGPLLEDSIAHSFVVNQLLVYDDLLAFKALKILALTTHDEFVKIYDPLYSEGV